MTGATSGIALVTGGMRRVGGAIADALADAGWDVARHVHHRQAGDGDDVFVADLADEDAGAALVAEIVARKGAPTLLVNSASRFVDDDIATIDATRIAAHHAVNTAAPVALALAVARAGPTGSIVNILDQRIGNPVRDQLSYSLSKAALAGMTRTLARALAPGWRVNAVAPGLTLVTDDYDDAKVARVTAAMPLARLPTPADVAAAVLYFATAPAVTAQTLFVDGGASLTGFERDFSYL